MVRTSIVHKIFCLGIQQMSCLSGQKYEWDGPSGCINFTVSISLFEWSTSSASPIYHELSYITVRNWPYWTSWVRKVSSLDEFRFTINANSVSSLMRFKNLYPKLCGIKWWKIWETPGSIYCCCIFKSSR